MNATAPSLYEDWRNRRAQLAKPDERLSEFDRRLQIRILDYLLKRYANSPLVNAPARFPLSTELFLNHRAILVHRYVSITMEPEIRNATEASRKASRILERIRSQSLQESTRTPAGGALYGRATFDPQAPRMSHLAPRFQDWNNSLRLGLLSEDPAERVISARALAANGTLDDVNLFLELLALPTANSEQKLLPIYVAESPPPPSSFSASGGIGVPVRADRDDPPPPPKPSVPVDDITAYRDKLFDNFEDVSSIMRLLKDAGPPQLPLPIPSDTIPTEAVAPNPSAAEPVLNTPAPIADTIDERAVWEECAFQLAQREHTAK